MPAVLVGYALSLKFDFGPEVVEAQDVGDGVELMVGQVVYGVADDVVFEFREAVEWVFIPTHAIVERAEMFIDGDNAFDA